MKTKFDFSTLNKIGGSVNYSMAIERKTLQVKINREFVERDFDCPVVVAEIELGNTRMKYRGKAVCSPKDVFSLHIGKKIALGRSLKTAYDLDRSNFIPVSS